MNTNNKTATLKRMFTGLLAAGMIGGLGATATFAAGQKPQFRGGQANVVRQQQPNVGRQPQANFNRQPQANFGRHDATPVVRTNQNFRRDDTRVRVDNRFDGRGREGFRPNVVVREPIRPFISVGVGGGYSFAAVADQNGYRDGFQAGRFDALNGRVENCEVMPAYRNGLAGYLGSYGASNLYRVSYQQGFERGYADGVQSV